MNDFDEDDTTKTHVDGEPVDLTEAARIERGTVAEHAKTPKLVPVCRECGRDVEPIEDWRPPVDADHAWKDWHVTCVRTRSASWEFCVSTGALWIGNDRYDFERRKKPRADDWRGEERRRR